MASAGRDIPVDLARFTSPFGTILYAHSETGLAALCFGEELEELSIPSRFQPSGKEVPSEIIENALTGYFDGSPIALDQVDLDLAETGFYSLCRAELRRVPFGETVTYKGLAALAGNPKAHRAAASACSTNPIPALCPMPSSRLERRLLGRLRLWNRPQSLTTGIRSYLSRLLKSP